MAGGKNKGGGIDFGPPPKLQPKTGTSTGAEFNAFINAHPIMRPYSDQIWKWAGVYGVDKVAAAALFWKESFAVAKATGQNPETIVSPTGEGVGIGQINPNHVGSKTPWGAVVSQADLTNASFNIRYSMWYFSQQLQATGDYNQAYARYAAGPANPSAYKGPSLTSYLPAGYVPKSGLSPSDRGTVTAETAAAAAAAKATINDHWAVLDNGKVKFVGITDLTQPPKNVLTYAGQPLTQTTFAQVWKQNYEPTFQAYTGRNPTGQEIKTILENAPSVYTLSNQLANEKGFSKSPVYTQHAGGLVALAKNILGNSYQVPGSLIRSAIAQNWDQATFENHLRTLPAYRQSPEFKTNLAQNTQAFHAIYGGDSTTDATVNRMIEDRTAAGWTPDQLQAWARSQPAYKYSDEYQAKSLAFASQLGLITGAVPTLSGQQVDQMLNAPRQLAGAPYSSAGSQQRAGEGVGGALNS